MYSKSKGALLAGAARDNLCVSRSSTEAEYIALSMATQEGIWLRRLMNDIVLRQDNPSVIYEDNQGAIGLSKNPKFHSRTKHIDIAFHFVREKVCDKSIDVIYCQTEEMMADIMMKPLSKAKFEKFRSMLGCERSSLTLI